MALPTPIRECVVAPAPVPGFGGGVRELRSRHYRNVFAISAETHAPVPGSVAAMLLLPIPVAHPPNKKIRRTGRIIFVVEVPGIEPGSLGEDLVILRAQFALAFLCPDVHANKMSTGTVTVKFSVRTRDRFRW